MNLTFSDLLPLLPLLLVTATVVVLMLVIAIKRSHFITCSVTVLGLLVAAIAAMILLPDANQQVTPLLIVDQYSLFFTLVTCVAALFISVMSYPYLLQLDDHAEEFYLLLALATIGAIVMVSSNHFISAILGIETLSMSLYGMIAYPIHSKHAAKYPLEASVKYLVLSAVSSGALLFGMALIYAQTGSLGFSGLAEVSAAGTGSLTGLNESFYVVALMLLSAGMAFKLSLAPFHIWTPDVYEGAPLPATAFLATIGKAAMFVLLLRYFVAADALSYESVVSVFSLIAALSILAGNLLALLQNSVKRILAYSSIAHMGYLLIALIATNFIDGIISVEAITFYLLAYVVMSLGAFGVVSMVSSSAKESDAVDDYTGLFWSNPWLAVIFTGMLLSLAGIPLTVGFIGKFYLFAAGVESGLWVLLAVLVVGSGIGLYYYLRIVYRMLMPAGESTGLRQAGSESTASFGVLLLLLFLLLLLGIYPAPVMSLVQSISAFI